METVFIIAFKDNFSSFGAKIIVRDIQGIHFVHVQSVIPSRLDSVLVSQLLVQRLGCIGWQSGGGDPIGRPLVFASVGMIDQGGGAELVVVESSSGFLITNGGAIIGSAISAMITHTVETISWQTSGGCDKIEV
jgi:hypothetical protein